MGERAVLVMLALIVVFSSGCGSDGDAAGEPVTTGAPAFALVSSTAQWVAGDAPSSEFDVTTQKTDSTVFGVELAWAFETAEPARRIAPDVQIGVRIDGQSMTSAIPIQLGGPDLGLLAPEVNPLYLVETEAGFTIHFVIGPLIGASDLSTREDILEGLDESGLAEFVDTDELTIDPLSDEGDDGALVYRVVLVGSISLDGEAVEIEAPIEFTTTESDPTIEAMAIGPSRLAAVVRERRRANEAAASS